MKTIKVIDLLNKVVNGEEIPKKIKYDRVIWEYTGHQYQRLDKENLGNLWNGYNFNILNNEVEIIEEKEFHAHNIEFNINNDKRDCIITLDENDLGIDKLHLDNCYFF